MALKLREDYPDQWVLRCYEMSGESAQLEVITAFDHRVKTRLNLLEEAQPEENNNHVNPWQIVSVCLAYD